MTLAFAPAVLVERLGWLLVHSVWQFALIALLLAVALRLLRSAPAGARYVAALVAWGAMLLAPAVTWPLLPTPLPASPAVQIASTDVAVAVDLPNAHEAVAPLETATVDSLAASPVALPSTSAPQPVTVRVPPVNPSPTWTESLNALIAPWLNTLVVIWCVGMCLFAARSAHGWYVVRRLLHRDIAAVPDDLTALLVRVAKQVGLRHRVRLLQSPHIDVPVAIGWLRPVILLPVCVVTGFSPPQLEAILAHELAHIRRHDYLINLLQNLSETIFFYHPALWWTSAIVRREREHCCDELAARALGNRAEYGRALLALEELRGEAPTFALGAKGGSLLERIRRLAQLEPTPRLGAGGVLGIALVAALVLSAAVWTAGIAGDRDVDAIAAIEPETDAGISADYATPVADRFAAVAAEQNLPFLRQTEIAALRRELHDYLATRVKRVPSDEIRRSALDAVPKRLKQISQKQDPYLRFRSEFNMLCWQLWVLAERRELTPAELVVRETQREWMRDYIRNLPQSANEDRDATYRHAGRLALLEADVFNHPLSPFFHEPMNDAEFVEFQQIFKERNGGDASNKLTFAPANFFWAVVRTRYRNWLERYPPGFPLGDIATDDEDEFFFGSRPGNVAGGHLGNGTIFDFDEDPPKIVQQSLEDVGPKSVTESQPAIDVTFLAQAAHPPYLPKNGTLVPVNGARLATLDTNEWHVADRIPLAEIRSRLADAPIDSFRLFDDVTLSEPGFVAMREACRRLPILAVETADGAVAMIRISAGFPDSLSVTVRLRPLEPNPPFHQGDELAQAGSAVETVPSDDLTHINIIAARHVLLLDGNQIVTWKEIDEKIAALPDPSRAYPHLYVTRGTMEAGLEDAAQAEAHELHRKYNLTGHSVGSLMPRTDFHYDRIQSAADLEPDPALRVEGTVVDKDGDPVAGAEVVLITPVDESLAYKAYDIYVVSGRVRNPLAEILTRTDDAGKFAVYPPKDTPFRVLALHPEAGIALRDSESFSQEPKLPLIPWGGIVMEFSKEPEEQSASLRTHLDARDELPAISITQYWEDLKRPGPVLVFEFTHVPPIWQTSISRDFRQPDGGSTGIPGASVSVLPGETRRLSLGPVTEQQREFQRGIRGLREPRAEATPAKADNADGQQTETVSAASPATESPATGSATAAEAKDETKAAKREPPPTTTLAGTVVAESGRPVPSAIVEAQYYAVGGPARIERVSDEQGRFAFEIPSDRLRGVIVVASTSDRQQMAIAQTPWEVDASRPPELTLTLKPALRADVQVVGSDRQPMADAKVAVRMNNHGQTSMHTDPQGRAVIMFPADAELHEVVASKAGLGLDYKSWFDRNRAARRESQIPPDLSEPIELVLTQPLPLTVTVVDADAGEPMPDIPVSVWLFQKPGEPDSLNVAYYQEDFRAKTDVNGVATIDWMPSWLADSRVVINAHSKAHENHRTDYTVAAHDDALTIKLHRLVPLSGRVTFPDGRPAQDITLQVIGEGFRHESFRTLPLKTDADGRYEVNVAPNQAYLLVVDDKQWAAPEASGFVVLPGQPKEDVDFKLQPATRLFGRVTMGPDNKPVADQEIHSYQSSPIVNLKEAGVELPADADQIWANPYHVRRTKTDSDGRFELFVGPGKYDLRGPKQNAIEKFEIATETEREFNFHSPRAESGPFSGLVVAGDPPQPVPNAKIYGVYRHPLQPVDIEATTDADGQFSITRELHSVAMQAVNEDRTQAAIVEIGPDDETVTMTLQPNVTARGTLIDGETSQPMPNAEIQYYVSVPLGDQTFRPSFHGSAATNDQGEFTLERLVVGAEYTVNVVTERNPGGYVERWRHITKLLPTTPGETIALGDTVAQPTPAPYKPPTLDDRIATAFHKKDTAATRYQNSLRDIRIGHLRLLLIVADPDAELTRQFFRLRYDDEEVRAATDNHWLTPLPLTGEKADDTREFIGTLGIEISDPAAPVFVVIDEHETRLATVEAADLSTDGAIDKQKVLDLLAAFAPEQLDAQVLLDEALATAKAGNRRVFVQESATWCGPCWMLSRFIAAHREVLEQDYIFVKLDHRWPHAQEIGEKLRNGEHSGIPWSAILDAEGTILATSDGPDGNIGFPSKSEPQGIEHFLKMLRDSRIRLTDADLVALGAALRGEEPR